MKFGYARVSTQAQDHTAQLTALAGAGVEKVFTEKASGSRWDRVELHRVLEQLREGDVEAGPAGAVASGSIAHPGIEARSSRVWTGRTAGRRACGVVEAHESARRRQIRDADGLRPNGSARGGRLRTDGVERLQEGGGCVENGDLALGHVSLLVPDCRGSVAAVSVE